MKKYEEKIKRIAKKLKFVYQDEQRGFGHAVYQAKDFAQGEPVLLLLGDTIYQSNTNVPCTRQLLNVYEQYGQDVVAVQGVPLTDVVNYGIFSGVWENKEETVLKVTGIEEKPDRIKAKDFLCVPSRKSAENYFAAFGAYVITEAVFDRLGDAIRENIVNAKGEVELTDALAYVCEKQGMLAFVPDGKSYDLGNAESYRKTVSEFGL